MPYVGNANAKGRGVFADKRYRCGDLIETCPVIVLAPSDYECLHENGLYGYVFGWGENQCALALGYGSLYNHSYRPNARYENLSEEEAIQYVAIRTIAKGEEICVNYNGDPEDRSPLWFDVVE